MQIRCYSIYVYYFFGVFFIGFFGFFGFFPKSLILSNYQYLLLNLVEDVSRYEKVKTLRGSIRDFCLLLFWKSIDWKKYFR